ncbi:MAG: hypothetical protein ACI4Q3_03540 [Kiritimatiellia bacterium]
MKSCVACLGVMVGAFAVSADIVRISEPDAYVQDGLVALYDGIRNVGLSAEHDSAATEWACLVPGGPNLEFKPACGTLIGEEGFWVSDGYVFMRATLAEMKANITLGENFTIQCVCELDVRPVSQAGDQYEGSDQGQSGEGYPTLIGEAADYGIYLDRQWSEAQSWIYWKCNGIAIPSTGVDRPHIWLTYPRTLTALADSDQYGIFDGATRANMNTREMFGSYANTKFSLGGRINSDRHYSKGLYRGARFYNRALSDEELARNHRVDMVRHFHYHPTGTLTIARSPMGATGVEGVGTWEVTGTHTFTAPARVTLANGNVYRCTGYELNVSDDGATLGAVEVHADELSYTYDNTAGDARGVRLAWTWELEEGLVPLDAASYVADGLVFQLDGIENAGAHSHSDDAATWHDLAGGRHAGRVRTSAAGVDGNWTDTGYAFHFGDYFMARARTSTSLQSTLQVACSAPGEKMAYNRASLTDKAVTWPTFVGARNDAYNLFQYAQSSYPKMRFKTNYTTSMLDFAGDGVAYTCFHDSHLGGPTAIAVSQTADYPADADWKAAEQQTDDEPVEHWAMGGGPCHLFVGGLNTTAAEEQHCRNLRGIVHAVRYYTRLLTPSELAHNSRLDDIRFRGGADAALVVASDRLAACGNEPNGPYDFAGTRDFSAPAQVTAGGRTYACCGYRLESWDATNGFWTNPREGDGTQVTLDSADGRQRLTWRWSLVRALRTAADFDVDDYVQDGLLAAYDGIRNVGVASRHAAHADVWSDWSGNGKAATIHQLNLSACWTNHVEGAWVADAYRFNGEEVMVTDRAIGIGRTPTIQGRVDFVVGEQLDTMNWPTLIALPSDGGVFTTKGDATRRLQWKTDPIYGNANAQRASISPWGGRYFTLQATGEAFYAFEGAERTGGKAFAYETDAPVKTWAIGAGHLDGNLAKERAMVGGFHTLRFYNRLLSDDELRHNRAVDTARFDGVLATTNLVVAISREQIAAEAVDPRPGAYQVAGEWTLKASPVQVGDGDGAVAWRPVGYELAELGADGQWQIVSSHRGDTCTYVPGTGVQRILWRYSSSRGFAILIR